ncbi:MAG: hypothetical protein IJ725_04895 [Ruminococcus sp.]|nr:hypothetical protein [Ruminococcus sp.]
MNKLYISPEFEILMVEMIEDIIMASPENYSSYVDPNPGDWGDPIIDPDDDIEW